MNDFNIKKKQEIKNFDHDNEYEMKNEKIELNFDLINGEPTYSYSIKLEYLGNTEISKSYYVTKQNQLLNLLKYKCDYSFGKEQKMNIILEIKSFINSKNYPITTTIGEIIGNEKSSKIFYIKGNLEEEILEIKARKIQNDIKYLTIHFNLKIVPNKHNDIITEEQKDEYFTMEKNKLYFAVEKDNKRLYESESFTDDGKFNIIQIPIDKLNNNFSILFLNWKNQNICSIKTSINELTDKNKNGQIFFSKQISLTEKLYVYNFSSIKEKITFLDYINNGMKIGLDIGIDFTGSNGPPDEPDSLHFWEENQQQKNPYERAILSCGTIMANYDYDKLFPVYGFGAIIKGHKNPSMCFNINFKKDPNIKYIDNIIKEYHNCLDKIIFSGPTHFAPIINNIIEDIRKQNDICEYRVLMILTDGMIDDLQDTIDALVEGSFYPLSVIIIGIGNADFSKMEQLDGDEIPLISRKGIKRQRDLVQFVPFNKFEGDEIKLREEVLEEIPRQVIEYYTLNFIYPELLSNDKDNNIKNNEKEDNKNNFLKRIGSFVYEGSINPLMSMDYKSNQIENQKDDNECDNYYEINRKFSAPINSPFDSNKNLQKNIQNNSINIMDSFYN